jgi:hypothetical protein
MISNVRDLDERMKAIDSLATIQPNSNKERYTGALAILRIQGKEILTLVDSGSYGTFISEEWVKRLGLKIENRANKRNATTATGENISSTNKAIFGLTLRDKEHPWEAWVLKRSVIPLIIGMDYLNNSVLDFPNKVWKFEKDEEIPITITQRQEKEMIMVIADHELELPAQTEAWMRAEVLTDSPRKREIEIKGIKREGLEVDNTLTRTRVMKRKGFTKEVVYLHLSNTSKEGAKVVKGKMLAVVDTSETLASIAVEEDMGIKLAKPIARGEETHPPSIENTECQKEIRERYLSEDAVRKSDHVTGQIKDVPIPNEEQHLAPRKSGETEDGEGKVVKEPRGSTGPQRLSTELEGASWSYPDKECQRAGSPSRKREKEGQTIHTLTEEELKAMIQGAQVSERKKRYLRELLEQFRDRFSEKLTSAGMAKYIPHRIKLKVQDSVYTAPIRMGQHLEDEMAKEIEEMAKSHVVRRTWSAYNSPMLMVKKKDGTWRKVIDYRNLNKVTIKEPYPLPRLEDAFDALAEAKYMTTFDFTSGYWQIPIAEEDKEKTAFTVKSGRWEYNVLPMGITNAAPTFQRNMEMMLDGLLWTRCIVYIDDVIIFGRTFEEHTENLRMVLERMREFNVVAKPKKCEVARKELYYLGHKVGGGQIRPSNHNIEKIRNMPMPKTIKEVRSFVCLAGYYRRFIEGFATIAKPLTELQKKEEFLKLRKIGKFNWQLPKDAEEAVTRLKVLLTSEPVLQLPKIDQPFEMKTDASQYAIGGVLYQRDKQGREHPVWYGSRVLNSTEQGYSTTEREMLAIYYWMRYWRAYLLGRKFVVHTDHSPLTGIKTSKDITGRLTRMILKLQEYDFDIKYLPGKKNVVADGMTRGPIARKDMAGLMAMIERKEAKDIEFWTSGRTLTNTLLAFGEEKKRKNIRNVKLEFREREREKARKHIRRYQCLEGTINKEVMAAEQQADATLEEARRKANTDEINWAVLKEVVYRIRPNKRRNGRRRLQMVLPCKYREEIMEAHHDEALAGHLGQFKTVERIAQHYWWPDMEKDVKRWVEGCETCQRFRKAKEPRKTEMKPIIANHAFEIIGMDIVTPLKVSMKGNKHLVVITDYYTKWAEAYALPDIEAETIARVLIREIISRHGAPRRIITDRGSQFMSKVFREVTELIQMKHSPSTAYHPQTDGQTERTIGTITNILKKLVKEEEDWELQLPYALFAYRTAVHEATKETPFFLLYGRDPQLPADAFLKGWVEKASNPEALSKEVAIRFQNARKRVIETVQIYKERMKERSDKRIKPDPFREGDQVWLDKPNKRKNESQKFKVRWLGPYRIIKKRDNTAEIESIRNPDDKRHVNIDRLRKVTANVGEASKNLTEQVKELAKEETQPPERVQKAKDVSKQQKETEKVVRNKIGKDIYAQERKRKPKRKWAEEEEFEVEKITQERNHKGEKQYRIKWSGYDNRHNRWISEKELQETAPQIVSEWKKRRRF